MLRVHREPKTGAVTMEVIEGPLASVEGVINLNAYPLAGNPARDRIIAYAEGCRDHLAVAVHAVDVVAREIVDDGDRLFMSLSGPDFRDVDVMMPWQPRVVRHGMSYFAGLFTALGASKSALDCFAVLAVQVIEPGNKNDKLAGFHKGAHASGVELSGAKLIKWLRRTSGSGAPDFAGRAQLADLFERATRDWITEAVKFRDDLVHHGHIRGARGSTIVLDRPVAQKLREDVEPPALPGGVLVADYCVQLRRDLLEFVYEASVLLPDVRAELLARPTPIA